jgi:hypothetical protein
VPRSLAEEVLQHPHWALTTRTCILNFLRQDEVLALRAASRACRAAVAQHPFKDEPPPRASLIKGSLASWRRCFPRATYANLCAHKTVVDDDLVHLRGVTTALMHYCSSITDSGLTHLRGILTLHARGCGRISDVGLAHLSGIQILIVSGCPQVTDAGLAHLRGIHTLGISGCTRVTDAGLAHLRGVRKLWIKGCPQLTQAGLAQLSTAVVHR